MHITSEIICGRLFGIILLFEKLSQGKYNKTVDNHYRHQHFQVHRRVTIRYANIQIFLTITLTK